MKALQNILIPLVGAVGLLGSGCGDNDTCAEGQTQSNGMCVVGGVCGAGTTLDTETNTCVPDGSMVCTQGTVFDAETGTCLVDPSACDAGTVLVEGVCIPEDETLEGMADHAEGPEPNDGITGIAGSFGAPAEGEDVTFFGCIEPTEDTNGDNNDERDVDAWVIDASGPTLLDIKADGIRGLSAAFQVVNGDIANSPALDAYNRIGVNLTGDTSQRQLYLPIAGLYILFMDDSRALFLDSSGTEEACYFTTVTGVAMPAATPLVGPLHRFDQQSDVAVFSYAADAEGDILVTDVVSESAQVSAAYVVEKGGAFSIDTATRASAGGLDAATGVRVIYDPVFNYALSPQPHAFAVYEMPGTALNVDGTATTVTKRNGADLRQGFASSEYLFFDVAAGGAIVHFDMTSDVDVVWTIMPTDIFSRPSLANVGLGATFQGEHVRFLEAGRYYLQSTDPAGIADDTYAVTATLTELMPSALTYGAPLADTDLPATGVGFHTVDVGNPIWSDFTITDGADLGATAAVALLPLVAEGWIGVSAPQFSSRDVPTDGTDSTGIVLRNLSQDFLVAVTPSVVNPNSTYTIEAADKDFANLGSLTEAAPVDVDDTAMVAGEFKYFFLSTAAGADVVATATDFLATNEAVVIRLDRFEGFAEVAQSPAVGTDAVLSNVLVRATPENFLAFAVLALTDDDTFDLNFTAEIPAPYNVAAGNLTFTDVCSDAAAVEVLTLVDEVDSGLRPFPFAFEFFGNTVTEYNVSDNGIILFDGASDLSFLVEEIPTEESLGFRNNQLAAPFWADLANVTACVLEEATKVTIQWEGNVFGGQLEVAHFQAILNDSGVLEFVYGPNHTLVGAETATSIGLEDANGLFGHSILFNESGVSPGDSFVMTPQ